MLLSRYAVYVILTSKILLFRRQLDFFRRELQKVRLNAPLIPTSSFYQKKQQPQFTGVTAFHYFLLMVGMDHHLV